MAYCHLLSVARPSRPRVPLGQVEAAVPDDVDIDTKKKIKNRIKIKCQKTRGPSMALIKKLKIG
jgi:hypothetical protein